MIEEELEKIEQMGNKIKEEETKRPVLEISTEEKTINLEWEVGTRFDRDSWTYVFEIACEDVKSAKEKEEMLRGSQGILRTTEKKVRNHIYRWVEKKMKRCVRTMKVEDKEMASSLGGVTPYNYSMMEWNVKEVQLEKAVIEVIEEKNVYIVRVSGPVSQRDFSEIKGVTYIYDGHIFCLKASSERQEGRVLSVYTKEYAKFYEVE